MENVCWLGLRVGSHLVLFSVLKLNWLNSRSDLVTTTVSQTLRRILIVICTLAESCVKGAAREAGAAAEVAATGKEKYADLDSRYLFEPIAVETLGVLNSSANSLLKEIGHKISLNTGESREVSYLHQRISVLVQQFNAILLHDSLPITDGVD